MSAAKKTPWFGGDVKPVRPGVYQQMIGSGAMLGYQRWDGKHWYAWCEAADEAADSDYPVKARDPWRGLASKPAGA